VGAITRERKRKERKGCKLRRQQQGTFGQKRRKKERRMKTSTWVKQRRTGHNGGGRRGLPGKMRAQQRRGKGNGGDTSEGRGHGGEESPSRADGEQYCAGQIMTKRGPEEGVTVCVRRCVRGKTCSKIACSGVEGELPEK